MKAIEVISVLAMAIIFTLIGWQLFTMWILSFPSYHPYKMRPHLIENLLIIPLVSLGILIGYLLYIAKASVQEIPLKLGYHHCIYELIS